MPKNSVSMRNVIGTIHGHKNEPSEEPTYDRGNYVRKIIEEEVIKFDKCMSM